MCAMKLNNIYKVPARSHFDASKLIEESNSTYFAFKKWHYVLIPLQLLVWLHNGSNARHEQQPNVDTHLTLSQPHQAILYSIINILQVILMSPKPLQNRP